MRTYYIGADGGGTRTTCVLISETGEVLAVKKGGGLNYHTIGMENVQKNLSGLIASLVSDLQDADIRIGVGMSALDDKATESQLSAFAEGYFDKEKLFLHSDAYAALMAATLGQSGVIVICGTGSMAVYADENLRQTPGGGWGYLLGDAGSSYNLAIDGMRAAIADYEETAGKTLLKEALMKRFSLSHPRALIDFVYADTTRPSDIAKFAMDVLTLAEKGDSIAAEIVDRHMEEMAKIVYSLTKKKLPSPVWLYGGVFEHNPFVIRLFESKLNALCPGAKAQLLSCPPAVGAAIYAMNECGALNEIIIENIKNTYKEMDF